jgi:hypothetical protein
MRRHYQVGEHLAAPVTIGFTAWSALRASRCSAAIDYTLIEIAKLNCVDPQASLTDILAKIADHKINELLPC